MSWAPSRRSTSSTAGSSRALRTAGAEALRLQAAYTETHLGARVAARDGHVDEIVEPGNTRDRLTWALRTLGCERPLVISAYAAVGDSFSAGIPRQTPWPDRVAARLSERSPGLRYRNFATAGVTSARWRRTSSAPRWPSGPI